MGNKNTSSPKGPDAEVAQQEDVMLADGSAGSVCADDPRGPGPELLAALQSLGESSEHTLLPHSLHQIAEAYWQQEDYQLAVQFLQLEKLYHERLLANLAALQETWESQWRNKDTKCSLLGNTDGTSRQHIETLSHICRTHQRPSASVEKQNKLNAASKESLTLQSSHSEAKKLDVSQVDEKTLTMSSEDELSSTQITSEEDEDTGEEAYVLGQVEDEDQCEDTPEDEDVKVEWPAGVPQASDKDLAKLSHKDGNSSSDGLVSILKRRRASLDGLPPPTVNAANHSSKRKVRFKEPEDQDDVGGDSCLILLMLCVVTVVISIGGTALYCALVGTYSNICTDFTRNANFYATGVRRFFGGLGRWLSFWT